MKFDLFTVDPTCHAPLAELAKATLVALVEAGPGQAPQADMSPYGSVPEVLLHLRGGQQLVCSLHSQGISLGRGGMMLTGYVSDVASHEVLPWSHAALHRMFPVNLDPSGRHPGILWWTTEVARHQQALQAHASMPWLTPVLDDQRYWASVAGGQYPS